MLTTYKCKRLNWVDVESPTAEDIRELMKKYGIHPLVAEELLKSTVRARVDIYKNFIYLILHFPIFDLERQGSLNCEIDFIIGKNFLVTAHYKNIIPLYETARIFEVNKVLKNNQAMKDSGAVLCFILQQFYLFTLRQLDHIQLKIEKIEDGLFKGREYKMVEAISYVHRDLLSFQKSIYTHEGVLSALETAGRVFLGKDFAGYFSKITNEVENIKKILENFSANISSLQATNDSLLTNRSNETMKTLNILAFLTFPLMLFAALFNMNTTHTPIIGMKGDFWIIVGMMTVATIVVVVIFKRKKWL